MPNSATALPVTTHSPASSLALKVLSALSASHLLNDTMQSLLLALYPLLKGTIAYLPLLGLGRCALATPSATGYEAARGCEISTQPIAAR
jgi:hypothetical protein